VSSEGAVSLVLLVSSSLFHKIPSRHFEFVDDLLLQMSHHLCNLLLTGQWLSADNRHNLSKRERERERERES
jgi:hypothetical protein